MDFQELDNDQRRDKVNSDQRFAAWRDAKGRAEGFRGSLVRQTSKGEDSLVRSSYDGSGLRRQTSLDIDLLMDARRSLRIVASGDIPDLTLINLVR